MPLGSVPVVMAGEPALTVMPTFPVVLLAGLLESVARTVIVLVPGVVGVPLTAQPLPSMRPEGSAPPTMEQLYGPVPPVTPMVPVYGVLTVPLGRVPVVSTMPPCVAATARLKVMLARVPEAS